MAAPTSPRARLVLVAALAALAGVALVATLAIAHNRQFANSVTISKAKNRSPAVALIIGKVLSGNPNCRRHREVQVYRVDVNPEVRLFTTYTKAGGPGLGQWQRKTPALPNGAKVQALIETKVLPPTNAAHDHICPVDRSAVRTVPYP